MQNHANIDSFITDLLHIEDVEKNKLIDVDGGNKSKTFNVYYDGIENVSRYVINIAAKRIGKTGNTALRNSSAAVGNEQIIGQEINAVDWVCADGTKDVAGLKKFIVDVYKELSLKGNNPLFLSVGAIKWQVSLKNNEVKTVKSPLILLPIKLIRSENNNTPVYIEFINDDIYLNPCLIAKLRQVYGDKIVNDFPHPNGENASVDDVIDLTLLKDGEEYLEKVFNYVERQKRSDISANTVFEFDKNDVCISQYNHDELCMYYDIKRNKEKIYSHALVNRIFNKSLPIDSSNAKTAAAQFVLPRDSVQERIIKRVVGGESLIIKGPPGTGKTLTITNMIASLLAANKKVLLSSTKVAAMNEVYAKLPDELRKFVMLLDCETESQASKLNPTDVKKEFSALLSERKRYTAPSDMYENLERGRKEKSAAVKFLSEYVSATFENEDVIGLNYYDALNVLCKTDEEPIKFVDAKYVSVLDRNAYLDLLKKVEFAEENFNKITKNHEYYKNPFAPLYGGFNNCDLEKVLTANGKISEKASQVIGGCQNVIGSETDDYQKLTLNAVEAITGNKYSLDDVNSVVNPSNKIVIESIEKALKNYLAVEFDNEINVIDDEKTQEIADALISADVDGSLLKSEFINLYNNQTVFNVAKDEKKVDLLVKCVNEIERLKVSANEKFDEFYAILRKDISSDDLNEVTLAHKVLAAYAETGATAPKALDFAAKKRYNKLKTLGYGNEIPFAEVVKAVITYNDANEINLKIEEKQTKISSLLNVKLNAEQLSAVFRLVYKSLSRNVTVNAYLKWFNAYNEAIFAAIKNVDASYDYSIADLIKAYEKRRELNALFEAVTRYSEVSLNDCVSKAQSTVYLKAAVDSGIFGRDDAVIFEKLDTVYKNGLELNGYVKELKRLLSAFKEAFYATYYTSSAKVTIGDLNIFVNECEDRSVLSATGDYLSTVNGDNVLPINRFFQPFELAKRSATNATVADVFERSIYYLAIQNKLQKSGIRRNGLGDKIIRELYAYQKGERAVDYATLKIIESQCMSRINPDDNAFAFLSAERSNGESLRKLFKTYASQILKLKKCFILSPSTASLFFTKDEFSDFDIVIIDEASQLEPTAILPVLFRAKQVVLVGDEWQMPPIKHFASKGEKRLADGDGDYEILSPNTSALSLALSNCAFPVEQFLCHYRSKTESLIAFSQKSFYPYMRTFPAALPKAEGLGFKDVYVSDGCCDGGVNKKEAEKTVEEINAIFNLYYDDASGKLTQSVGVVGFGKEQVDYIYSLVQKNQPLYQKIKTAIANFDDVPEKLIFFKTIETVQGQETDHLILSLTYGKDKNGKISQRFGELNRGFDDSKLGQCIFNVAVTRAKSSVTFIHSVTAEEIDNPSVSFISEYLDTVRKFSKNGKTQFVGKSLKESTGFVNQVAKYITTLGVSEERIVINCGVTAGSVKIPLVVLSEDLSQAKLGVWLEQPLTKEYDYLDYNLRYVESLRERGWNVERLYIHDWVDNNAYEKQKLKEAIEKYVN